MNANAILYFVKYPTPGKVKTRLAKSIGEAQAAELYRQLAEENFTVVRACRNSNLIVFLDPPEDQARVHQWLWGADSYIPQEGMGLGDRLEHAFQWAFDQGYKRVAAYGSDTLHLTTTIVEQGFVALKDVDVVIGPAKDGGYYLIGTTSNQAKLFEEIPWSTSEVLLETYKRINVLKLRYHTLCLLEDMDEVKSGGAHEFINSEFEKRRS